MLHFRHEQSPSFLVPDSLGTSGSDKSSWTVPILAEFMDARQKANEALVVARYDADQAAVRAALTALDKRLEEIQSFRTAMQEQAAHKVERVEFTAELRGLNNYFESKIVPIEKSVVAIGRPNWALFVSLASVVLAVIGGCWLLIGLEISVAIAPLALTIEQNKADTSATQRALAQINEETRRLDQTSTASTAADAESRTDRLRQAQQLTALADQFNAERVAIDTNEARVAEKLTEVETQFYAADQIRNLDTAHIQRLLSVLWHRTSPNEVLPTDNAYFPSISRQTPGLTPSQTKPR